jgi:hypothetical protein
MSALLGAIAGNFARNINVPAWMAGTSPAKTVSWRCVTPLARMGEKPMLEGRLIERFRPKGTPIRRWETGQNKSLESFHVSMEREKTLTCVGLKCFRRNHVAR